MYRRRLGGRHGLHLSVLALVIGTTALTARGEAGQSDDTRTGPLARPIGSVRFSSSTLVVADAEGGLAAWDRSTNDLASWDSSGESTGTCRLEDATLPREPGLLAARGRLALLTWMDHPAGNEKSRRALVVSLDSCEVKSDFTLPGLVLALTPGPDGWWASANLSDLATPEQTLVGFDNEGKVLAEIDIRDRLHQLAKAVGVAELPGGSSGKPVVVRKHVWFLPSARYELWRPRQRGLPFRELTPPVCLASTAQQLVGQESADHVLALSREWPNEIREAIEESARSGGVGPAFLSAIRGVAVHGSLLGVQVRVGKDAAETRLDIWDMGSEQLVAFAWLPASATLVGLGERFAWVRDSTERVRMLEFHVSDEHRDEPCVGAEMARIGKTSDPRPRPPREE